MATDRNIQVAFINWIKEQAADPDRAFADQMEELLCVSKDSIYRRMRGETLLSFDEISKISAHFHVSLDSFLNHQRTGVTFDNRNIGGVFTFINYLDSIHENLKMLNGFEQRNLIYAAKDVPLFHYFQYGELTAFKFFFWIRSILNAPEFENARYDASLVAPNMVRLARGIWQQYIQVPSAEIWSDETILITIRQLEYYLDEGVITREQSLVVTDELMAMVQHIREEAKHGLKHHQGKTAEPKSGPFQLYYNEIAIGDNTIFFSMNQVKRVYLTYNMLNTLSTSDEPFCNETEAYLKNIMSKSILLSATAEKERNRFFNRMEDKIEALRRSIQG